MDEMRIKSKLLTGAISKIIEKEIKKKFGYETDIQITGLSLSNQDGMVFVGGEIGLYISEDELKKIIKDHV